MDVRSQGATRAASPITMSFWFPSLVFANVVPAFTSDDISALGPPWLLAFVYTMASLVFGFVIREACHVPWNFWQGIVVVIAVSSQVNLCENLVVP